MSAQPNSVSPYKVGGGLDFQHPTYVVRQADRDFYDGLMAGEFCYVLNSRQAGKSSLQVQTMCRLQDQGIACAEIELNAIGSHQITPTQWYGGIIQDLVSGFELQVNRRRWWREHDDLSPVQRLSKFIEKVLLIEISQNIVIFVDEIDNVLSLDFPVDDFFCLIRTCYEKRNVKPEYRRLTFALLGVATPSDLIQDKRRTPFNIGREIELKGFRLDESLVLAQGLEGKVSNSQRVLQEVLAWTDGQPFLTQKLCHIIATNEASIPDGGEQVWVEQLVQSHLIKDWESNDVPEHLRTIRDRILRNKQRSKPLLMLYQKILRRGEITAKNHPEYRELQLSGLIVKQQEKLKVYNRIYKSVFNLNWVTAQLNSLQSDIPALPAWTVLMVSVAVTLSVIGVRQLRMLQTWELQVFDHLIQKLPPEPADKRLLIIGADETDISRDGYGHPLPDAVLAQLLDKLQAYQPSAIGLDIVRDQPVPKDNYDGYNAFSKHLKQNKKLIPVCAFGQNTDKSIRPPNLNTEMKDNVGFVDLYSDKDLNKQDDTVRRYLLSRSLNHKTPSSPCTTPYSFAWQLAYLYLAAKKTPVEHIKYDWKFGSIIAKRLDTHSGGYQNLNARGRGNQLLINYRRTSDSQKIAQQVTIRDVLTNSSNFDPAWVKDRVVLIGVTAASIQNYHDTPFGKMRGLFIHAHVVSQILSAVEDNRTLLWWLPQWGDALWILFWSCTGGIIVWRLKAPLHQGIAISIFIIVLYSSCWIVLKKEGWIPLIPSGLALVSSAGGLTIYKVIEAQKFN